MNWYRENLFSAGNVNIILLILIVASVYHLSGAATQTTGQDDILYLNATEYIDWSDEWKSRYTDFIAYQSTGDLCITSTGNTFTFDSDTLTITNASDNDVHLSLDRIRAIATARPLMDTP